jgi:hypothetical protein
MSSQILDFPLPVTANPGLETIDPRLDEIITQVQDGNYQAAAALSASILKEEIYDIRVICYYLYGQFLDQGVAGLGDIFNCLAELLSENLDAVGPARNRENQIQTIVNWQLKQLAKMLQYEERRDTSRYQGWVAGVTSDEIQEVLDAADRLRRILASVLEDAAGPLIDGLMKVNEWLTAFQRLVYQALDEDDDTEAELDYTQEEAWVEDDAVTDSHQQQGTRLGNPALSATVDGSHHLKELVRKLEAFDLLISTENNPGAAVVADDINEIIASFDPRLYFPKLFSGFTLQYLKNIGELVAFDDYKGGVEWQAMQQLYHVDLDSFVNFHSDGMSLAPASDDEAVTDEVSADEDPSQEESEEYDNADDGW